MRTKGVIKSKVLVIVIDPQLEKEKDKIYFPEKLKQTNEMLKTARLPELKHGSRQIYCEWLSKKQ